jgi:hypothetical protein
VSVFVVLVAILLGSLAAGSPTAVDTAAVTTAGIELGTPAHHASRVEAALPKVLPAGRLFRVLLEVVGAGLAILLVTAAPPLRTHLGLPLAAGRRGPPARLG